MSPLIEIDELRTIASPIIIIDTRGGADSYQRYLAGHLEGAIYADLDKDLAAKTTNPAEGGRHPLPPLNDFAITLGNLGIRPDSRVVLYDDKAGAFSASRFWWMLKAIGHQHVQVLNGGLQAAVNTGAPLIMQPANPVATSSYPVPSQYSGTVGIAEVQTAATNENQVVIDVRESARYLGQTEPIDLIAGHIPGAVNMPYTQNLDADGKFLQPEELKAAYESIIGSNDMQNVVVHCGSGVTACHTLLGLEYAGLPGAQLYVGSWSEWSRRDLPIATNMP